MQLGDRVKGVRSLLGRVLLVMVHAYERYPVQMAYGVSDPRQLFEILSHMALTR